jgi:hypothetical protein
MKALQTQPSKIGLFSRAMKRPFSSSLASTVAVFSGLAVLAAAPSPAAGADVAIEQPSVFTYAGRGFLVGAMVGLSAGYLTARSGGWNRDDDWQPLVYGTGIGALAGGVLGLSLGIVDMSRNTPGYGAVILRDTVYGAAFGAAAGGIVGTLAMVSTKNGEHVLLGAAVGALAGATAGVALGIVEGNRAIDRSRNPDPQARFGVTLSAAPGLDGDPVWFPAFLGRY